jgi:uncharacterized protein YacL
VITILGGLLGFFTGNSIETGLYYALISLIASIVLILIELLLTRKASGKQSIFAFSGLSFGLLTGYLLGLSIYSVFSKFIENNITIIFQIILGYVGFIVGWFKSEEFTFGTGQSSSQTNNKNQQFPHKILDTSVIIDGRISDIVETGFLEGEMIVPKFVLKELQQVADSSDPLKRSRGRRGLDMLNQLRQSKKAIITITDKDFVDVKEVDNKLLKLAKHIGGVVVTNDFNLNKIAEFQGVKVLNVNELSNAVKPIVLPNEQLKITVIKEGKDQRQGIAYLDDGTMIVVDNGKDRIGQEVDVIVTSILQTPAGRMIFTQLIEDRDKGIDVNEAKNSYKESYKDKDHYHHQSKEKSRK